MSDELIMNGDAGWRIQMMEKDREIERLRGELQAWRATFPIMHVRPGALFASTKLRTGEEVR